MVIAAAAMALRSGHTACLVLGGLILFIAGVMIYHVHWAVGHLARQSVTLREAAIQAEQHYVSVLRRIVRIVEGRDKHTRGHSERIGRLAERTARKLKLPTQQCEMLNLAGQLHDIGLLAVSEEILTKQTNFGAGDFRTVKRHSEVSYEVLEPLELLRPVLPAIRHHHERANGTGYPLGLSGQQIPLEARILAVADAYDAMTHDRPHRSAMTPAQAVAELRRCTPSGYDRQCVEALAAILGMDAHQRVAADKDTQEEVQTPQTAA
jgi:HD-GYP domain-containing protein (c-di-GMP phosphodiesterase class II)